MTSHDPEPGSSLTRRKLLGGCALGVATASAGCSGGTPFVGKREEIDRTFDMNTGRLTVETDSGDAAVRRTTADEIRLHGVKESGSVFTDLEDMTVGAARDGDHLRITADSGGSSWFGLGGSGSISLDAAVPSGVAVETVTAKNGDATATGVAGDTILRSTNGKAAARNVDGSLSLASTNGPVRARGVAGIDGARTTNGEIDIEAPAIEGNVSVSSTNGPVTAALSPDLDARVVASTTNGRITATGLPLDAGVEREHAHRDARRRHTQASRRDDQQRHRTDSSGLICGTDTGATRRTPRGSHGRRCRRSRGGSHVLDGAS